MEKLLHDGKSPVSANLHKTARKNQSYTNSRNKTNNKTKGLNPRITRFQDQCPNHSATPTSHCVLLFDFYKNYRIFTLFFGLSL